MCGCRFTCCCTSRRGGYERGTPQALALVSLRQMVRSLARHAGMVCRPTDCIDDCVCELPATLARLRRGSGSCVRSACRDGRIALMANMACLARGTDGRG